MDHVLQGPEMHVPVPIISFGVTLYEAMKRRTAEEILYVEAETGKQTTYKQFLFLCCRLARSLQRCGYKQNDIIVVSSENSSSYCVPIVASLFLGMISVPVNQFYTEGELSRLLERCQPKIVFCSIKLVDKFTSKKECFQCIEKIILLDDKEVDEYDNLRMFMNKYCDINFCINKFKPIEVNPTEQVAIMLSSSGTTGMPKGVMITHDNIAIGANLLTNPTLNLAKHEIIALALPYFHTFALMFNLAGMLKGNKIIFMKKFEEKLFLRTIQENKVSNVPIVPTIAYIFTKSEEFLKYDLTSVEEIFCAAAPLTREAEEDIIKRFPHLNTLRQAYGLTEATSTIAITPTGQRKTGSSGKIVPGHSLYIRDLKNGKTLGPNMHGEICVKGRMVTKGYYQNSEATRSTYIDGWLRTGDLGYYDEEGYLFVVDRIKEVIKYKGYQVSPTEIEGILVSHPKIKAASVVGRPDRYAGELSTAFVVRQPGTDITEEEIRKE